MKTAMQELRETILLDTLGDHINGEVFFSKEQIMEFIEEGIKKEKQQIVDAWKDNRAIIYLDAGKDELSDETAADLAEDYYNQTYNQ